MKVIGFVVGEDTVHGEKVIKFVVFEDTDHGEK